MKVILTITNFSNFQLACEATDIKIVEKKDFGTKVIAIVDYKHASQLYEAGLMQNGIVAPAINQSIPLNAPVIEIKSPEKTESKTDAKPESKKTH